MGGRAALVILACLVGMALIAVLGLRATGADLSDLWGDVALPLAVLGACAGVICLGLGATTLRRIRNRRTRPLARFQLVLSQADEATFEEVAAAFEQLVQTVRQSLTQRLVQGQPWLALESWFVPAQHRGETGTAALMLACEPAMRDSALAALRRAYPDLSLRADPAGGGSQPLAFVQPTFVPGHVLRVRKTRSWALPIGSSGRGGEGSDARATMTGIIRQQQQAARLSCVRWCVLPASDQLDSRAADKLEGRRNERPNPARSGDVQAALQAAGGAMAYLELQAAVETQDVTDRRGHARPESFSQLQNACRQLLAPALSHRGANHLSERMMVVRQGLYRRRWARGEPPLLPQPSGATLVSPRELALLMELPSLGSEHALPLQRNTIPNLPLPTEVPRAHQVDLALPEPTGAAAGPEGQEAEVVDAELVVDEAAAR
ncbi:MAG: hypothetical protein MSC31_16945 [Solirubrobacteraceae bacterium MAG38_C4-C5]|nr:hypothetical protein [Candidatus Siliceabacter maunaloa]